MSINRKSEGVFLVLYSSEDILVRVQATPNPRAWKFVMNVPVLNEGKVTFASHEEADDLLLARSLFQVSGVKQVHMFKNFITVTHEIGFDFDQLREQIISVIKTRILSHDPSYVAKTNILTPKKQLSGELEKIDKILDQHVRQYLQGDGGDIELISYEDNVLTIQYEGACGTCPSSTTGTLMAIESILRDEYSKDIQVVPLSDYTFNTYNPGR